MPVADQQVLQNPSRLEALKRYSATDLRAEASFDRLTRLASKMLDAPIALVNIVDDEKQLCKSAFGIDGNIDDVPNSVSFCAHTVTMHEPFVVEDTTKHPLLHDNPFVQGASGFHSYLGIPLETEDGYNIGTLCVLDTKRRQWDNNDIETLKDLAASVIMEIDLRAQMLMEQEALSQNRGYDPGRHHDNTPTHIPIREITRFGRYQIVKHIDSGGMCDVYLCKHENLQTPVAVKLLKHHNAKDKSFRARFELEGKIIASLKHPNIVRVFEAGNIGDNYYIAMEFISGQNLKDFIRENAPLPLNTVWQIAQDIAEALDYAHSYDVVHRDVKPSNVMLRTWQRNGRPVYQATLMDFGVARMVASNTDLTGDNAVGTIDYIAPEQITSSHTVTATADLYAFAIMIYEMLTGELPFDGENVAALIFERITNDFTDPRELRPSLPVYITHALEKALHDDPEQRYNNVVEFVETLKNGQKS